MKTQKYYVTMTDKLLSGWGEAEGKTSKYILVCDTLEQARKAVERAKTRSEMKYINICFKKPNYPIDRYHSSFKNIEDAPYFQ